MDHGLGLPKDCNISRYHGSHPNTFYSILNKYVVITKR